MTEGERLFLQIVVGVMLLACAFSKSLMALLIRFTFFSLLIVFLVFVFYQ